MTCQICYSTDPPPKLLPCCGYCCTDCLKNSISEQLKEGWGVGRININCSYCDSPQSYTAVIDMLDPDQCRAFLQNILYFHNIIFKGVAPDHPARALPEWLTARIAELGESLDGLQVSPAETVQCGHCGEQFDPEWNAAASAADAPADGTVTTNTTAAAFDLTDTMWIKRKDAIDLCATCPHCFLDTCRECFCRFDNHRGRTCLEYLKWAEEMGGDWDMFTYKNLDYFFSADQLRATADIPAATVTLPALPDIDADAPDESSGAYFDRTASEVQRVQEKRANLQEIHDNARPCPFCGQMILKNEGCNHMTCKRCTTNFCWVCDWEGFAGAYDEDTGETLTGKRVVTFTRDSCCDVHGVERTIPSAEFL